MENNHPRWARLAYWNLWPLARLGIVLAALALWLHWRCGLNPPTTGLCAEIVGGLVILLVLCVPFGLQLVRLYLTLLCFPLYAVVVLNALWYDGGCQLLRQFCGFRRPWLEACFGLACELALFIGMGQSAVFLLKS